MARSADLHIRIDPETKAGAEELYSMFGLKLTDAITMFLKQSLQYTGLPCVGLNGTSHSFPQSEHVVLKYSLG